jgi:transcription termination/antitermination protein NusG
MQANFTTNWYAVYTRPQQEKKVSALLDKKNIRNYCPLNRVYHQWSDRKKIIMKPLFTSYVFVNISMKEYEHVRQTDGVVNFVYWQGRPAVIRDEEINTVQKFLQDYMDVQLEKTEVNVHDNVRVISGPLFSREGNVIEIMNNKVKVLLPSMGYTLVAELNKIHLQKISTPSFPYAS